MNHTLDLSTLPWTLTGWSPWNWALNFSIELGMSLNPDVAPIPARVPGSVQQNLRDAGMLPDWTVQTNSRLCEWVENRHWHYETIIPAEWAAKPGRKVLVCDGLDSPGVLLVDGKEVGRFANSYVPHRFDLSDRLKERSKIQIIFTEQPRYLGQVGWTSKIKDFRTRFYFQWDWCPRLVQIGIWDSIRLEVAPAIESLGVWTDFDRAMSVGTVHVRGSFSTEVDQLEISVGDANCLFSPAAAISLQIPSVQPWQPNGHGNQPLYVVRIRALDKDGSAIEETTRTVGFRDIDWKPCRNAPAGADDWICSVNGKDVFLQGANWVPIRPFFADVTEADYRKRLTNYRDFGFNILRVWGGAVLEKEIFYQLCDEMGIFVWQELPFSSSGIDNWPPEDPPIIEETKTIFTSYIQRRQHHASLLLWCGGNELQGALDGGKSGIGKPIDLTHPMMLAMRDLSAQLDPTRRFLATSSTGPRFMADEKDFGKGLHHDVHGPWNQAGPLEAWYRYWENDDSLFRSETGMPGTQSADLIRAFALDHALPANKANAVWVHVSSWWFQWDDFVREGGDESNLDAFVDWSQKRQADAIGYAARKTKERFPGVGGFIVWMGHDCFPCPTNTSVFDVNGDPKPAAHALREVFVANLSLARPIE